MGTKFPQHDERSATPAEVSLWVVSLCLVGFAAGCTSNSSVSGSGSGRGQANPKKEIEKTSATSESQDESDDESSPGSALGGKTSSSTASQRDSRSRLKELQTPSRAEVDALVAAEDDAGLFVTVAHLGEKGSAFDLEVYRYGLTKALNSVSTNPEIVSLEAVDPGETVYRFTPGDFRLKDTDVQLILRAPGADRGVRSVGSSKVINGDWLVYAITRPEIYDAIMRIPNAVNELEAQIGVDMSKAISAEVPDGESEVTFARRTLVRVPIEVGGEPGGYYWRSIDYFTALTAGEFFFSLPNGLQGYMLSGFVGQHRIDAQPFVATDRNRAQDGLTQCVGGAPGCGYVINGESCITCHADGVKMNTTFFDVRGGTAEDFEAFLTQDADRFAKALAKMGFEGVSAEPVLDTLNAYRAANQVSDRRSDGGEIVPVNPDGGIFQR